MILTVHCPKTLLRCSLSRVTLAKNLCQPLCVPIGQQPFLTRGLLHRQYLNATRFALFPCRRCWPTTNPCCTCDTSLYACQAQHFLISVDSGFLLFVCLALTTRRCAVAWTCTIGPCWRLSSPFSSRVRCTRPVRLPGLPLTRM